MLVFCARESENINICYNHILIILTEILSEMGQTQAYLGITSPHV